MLKDNYSINLPSHPIEEYDPTNLCWLAIYIPSIGNNDEEILSNVVKLVKDFYKEVTLYHACCPERLNEYYENGLVKLDMDQECNSFKNLVKRFDNEYCEVELNRICVEAKDFFKDLPDNFHEHRKKVYCCLDKDYAYDDCREFYEGGSEFFRNLIGRLSNKNLRNRILGHIHTNYIPTILHLNLPIKYLGNENVNDIVRRIMWKWAGIYLANEDPQSFKLEYANDIRRSVDAKLITRHEHPRQAIQFNNSNKVYCDKCKKKIRRRTDCSYRGV